MGSRKNGTNPRSKGTSPRQRGISPKQLGVNPRELLVSPRQLESMTKEQIGEVATAIRERSLEARMDLPNNQYN